MIDTPLQEPSLTEESKKAIGASLPIGRLGVARDIANAALFLASDESSFMTGAGPSLPPGVQVTSPAATNRVAGSPTL